MSTIVGDVGLAEVERLILSHSEVYMKIVALEILQVTEVGREYTLSTIRDLLSRPSGQWLSLLMTLNPAFSRTNRNTYVRLDLAGTSVNVDKKKRKEERAACRACLEFLGQL